MKNPIGVRIVLLALAFSMLLTGGCVGSHSENSPAANGAVYLTPGKGEYPSMPGLKQYVFEMKENGHGNHFMAIKRQVPPDKETELIFYWEEQHRFIYLGKVTASSLKKALRDSHEESMWIALSKSLDLTRDLVERPEDINGSTYLETRAWAEEVKSQCEQRGVKFFVPAFDKLETNDN